MPIKWKYSGYDTGELLDKLSPRKWVNDNPKVIIVITNISVIAFLIMILLNFNYSGAARVGWYDKDWFYDLNTGQLFTADKQIQPPIESPTGPLPNGRPAGVRAFVFSYVANPDKDEYFIGFLATKDPNYVDNGNYPGGIRPWGIGKLIRRVGDTEWVAADSPQGRQIFTEALTPDENGHNPQYYSPRE